MTLNQLGSFAAAAEKLNLTKAAEAIGTNQSTLSLRIKELERGLGVALFVREGRTVRLTGAGALLFEQIVPILKKLDEVELLVKNAGRAESGTLKLISTNYYYEPLFKGIEVFLELYPSAQIQSGFQVFVEISKDIAFGRADLGISPTYESAPFMNIFDYLVLEQDDYCAVLPKEHPLHKKGGITMMELKNERTYISELTYEPVNAMAGGLLDAVGVKAVSTSEGHPIKAVITQARAGVGIALVPRSVAKGAGALNSCVTIDDVDMRFEQLMVWRKDNSNPTVKLFTDFLREYLKG